MNDAPRLITERLMLRPIRPDDAEQLFPIFSDADTMRWWSSAPFESVAALAAWLGPSDAATVWAVCMDGQPVGRIMLRVQRPNVAELGYLLAREQWGRGLAREAAGAVLRHGFATLGLRRIYADTDPDNAASIGTLAALGFTLEGRLRQEWETHIGVRDSLIFGLLRSDWEAQQRDA